MPATKRGTRSRSRTSSELFSSLEALARLVLIALAAALPACGGNRGLPRVLLNEIAVSDDPMRADQIEIVNLEADAVALDDWWLCSFPNYFPLPAGTTIPPGGILVVTLGSGTSTASEIFAPELGTLATNDGEVVLYAAANDFDDPDTMSDYVQWGQAGNDREAVAAEAGLWTAATFVSTATLSDGSDSVARLVSDGSVSGAGAWGIAPTSIGTN